MITTEERTQIEDALLRRAVNLTLPEGFDPKASVLLTRWDGELDDVKVVTLERLEQGLAPSPHGAALYASLAVRLEAGQVTLVCVMADDAHTGAHDACVVGWDPAQFQAGALLLPDGKGGVLRDVQLEPDQDFGAVVAAQVNHPGLRRVWDTLTPDEIGVLAFVKNADRLTDWFFFVLPRADFEREFAPIPVSVAAGTVIAILGSLTPDDPDDIKYVRFACHVTSVTPGDA